MRVVKNPFESHVYQLVGVYEERQGIGQGPKQLHYTEEAEPFFEWLEMQGKHNWQMVGLGMLKVDPKIESLFVLRWVNG